MCFYSETDLSLLLKEFHSSRDRRLTLMNCRFLCLPVCWLCLLCSARLPAIQGNFPATPVCRLCLHQLLLLFRSRECLRQNVFLALHATSSYSRAPLFRYPAVMPRFKFQNGVSKTYKVNNENFWNTFFINEQEKKQVCFCGNFIQSRSSLCVFRVHDSLDGRSPACPPLAPAPFITIIRLIPLP